MPAYRVRWEIDLDASCPQEAAEGALAIQRRFDSTATVFDVWPTPTRLDPDRRPVGLVEIDVRPEGAATFPDELDMPPPA